MLHSSKTVEVLTRLVDSVPPEELEVIIQVGDVVISNLGQKPAKSVAEPEEDQKKPEEPHNLTPGEQARAMIEELRRHLEAHQVHLGRNQ